MLSECVGISLIIDTGVSVVRLDGVVHVTRLTIGTLEVTIRSIIIWL